MRRALSPMYLSTIALDTTYIKRKIQRIIKTITN